MENIKWLWSGIKTTKYQETDIFVHNLYYGFCLPDSLDFSMWNMQNIENNGAWPSHNDNKDIKT